MLFKHILIPMIVLGLICLFFQFFLSLFFNKLAFLDFLRFLILIIFEFVIIVIFSRFYSCGEDFCFDFLSFTFHQTFNILSILSRLNKIDCSWMLMCQKLVFLFSFSLSFQTFLFLWNCTYIYWRLIFCCEISLPSSKLFISKQCSYIL